MTDILKYLVELNISMIILFAAYKLFFEKDRNFVIRRVFLMGVALLPLVLPLLPSSLRMPVGQLASVSITLDELVVLGNGSAQSTGSPLSFATLLWIVYLIILAAGLIKMLLQLGRILTAVIRCERFSAGGQTLLACKDLHASSFFGWIFIDPDAISENSFSHILEHERIHKREAHSLDRLLVEILVIINWFNPVAWLFRRSVIQNLEYLADSAVLNQGTDPVKYQLSLLNQYIGSASISNQFSNQIKNRIKMLNRNYKLGSRWKLLLLVPLSAMAFFFVACTEKDIALNDDNAIETMEMPEPKAQVAEETATSELEKEELFYIVEDMPSFNGDDTAMEFRKFIASNLRYPEEASNNGVSGKVFIKFVVTHEGKVVIPSEEYLAKQEGVALEEVVVVSYRTLEEGAEAPDEKYIDMLKQEVRRVISLSPDWEPGMQRGKKVNVLFTFPVTFALQ